MASLIKILTDRKPCKARIEFCYKCSCGVETWYPLKKLKGIDKLFCMCGTTIYIKRMNGVVINYVDMDIPTINYKKPLIKKAVSLLKNQGFAVKEARAMITEVVVANDIKKYTLKELVKQALQTMGEE